MSALLNLGIIKKKTQASELFESFLGVRSFEEVEYELPHEYVLKYWNEYLKSERPTLGGNIFELIISTLLYRENLLPLYLQAQVAFVPNVHFDALLYNREFGPVSLSMKTSLRERYKQADLEAIALKYVHRKAKCYLLTMEEREGTSVKNKIKTGDVIGLDEVIICSTSDIDDMISNLKQMEFTEAGTVEIIKSWNKVTKAER